MKIVTNILMKFLAVIFFIAAALKAHQLLSEPVLAEDVFSARSFQIFQVEFELVLGIWLLSGLFKKAAWLAALLCFCGFSIVTLYKAITGCESCGCFGWLHVNPWLTLFAIDLPAVAALIIFRPELRLNLRQKSLTNVFYEFLTPPPKKAGFTITAALTISILAVTTPILIKNKPANATASYEVLEPETWVGKRLTILDDIDIGPELEKGNWLILFYHHDCPDCRVAIRKYRKLPRISKDLNVAFIEVPPYGPAIVPDNVHCKTGKLQNNKQWFITTPATVILKDAKVKSAWEAQAPDIKDIYPGFAIHSVSGKRDFHPEYLSPNVEPLGLHDKYCGPYVVWHALNYYKLNIPLQHIAQRLRISKKKDFTEKMLLNQKTA